MKNIQDFSTKLRAASYANFVADLEPIKHADDALAAITEVYV